MSDQYDDQLKAARYRAERDQARQELARLRGEVTTVSAYELLPEEDRETLRWVREKGGVEGMRRRFGVVCQQAEDGRLFALSVARMLHSYDEVYGDGGLAERDDMEDLLEEELGRRLMPEGIEWPRYEDGEPVYFGDAVEICGITEKVEFIQLFDVGYFIQCGDREKHYAYGERVKRPAVLAADKEPLEVGQTVWDANGDEFRVLGLYGGPVDGDYPDHTVRCRRAGAEDYESTMCEPSQLTHRRPVLDAVGVPIHEGETVYANGSARGDGTAWRVLRISPELSHSVLAERADGRPGGARDLRPEWLTHTKPEQDSWERIEEDARGLDRGVDRELFTHTHEDLVRRCRVLAGVSD